MKTRTYHHHTHICFKANKHHSTEKYENVQLQNGNDCQLSSKWKSVEL